MKAVIADDEIRVCKLIERLIDWEKLGIEIIGEAYTGIEALNLITAEKPDIVITDIRMPGLDGLELIKKVRESGINTSFVIISGHKQFEYAQTAVKYGVEDYLLKPINREELYNIVFKLKKQHVENNEKAEDEKKLKIQLANSIEKLRKQFIVTLLTDPEKVSTMPREVINREYQFDFIEGYFQVIALKLDKRSPVNVHDNYEDIMLNKLLELMKKCIGKSCKEIDIVKLGSLDLCLLNYSEENAYMMENSFKTTFEQLHNYLEISEYFYITMALGSVENDFENLGKSLSSAIDCIQCRIVLGFDKILNLSKYKLNSVNVNEVITPEIEKELVHYIEGFDKEGLKNLINGIFDKISIRLERDPLILLKVCSKLIDISLNTMKKLNMENEEYTKDKILKRIDSCRRPREVQKYMLEFVDEYLEFFIQSKKMQENKPIRIAKQYVSESYMEPISLEDIAEVVQLNPVYFSVIFKKETGINFTDYLINYRLDIAKELLKDTNNNISQVAYAVGYKDAKYFSKLFAKVVGIKPLEYKKLYS